MFCETASAILIEIWVLKNTVGMSHYPQFSQRPILDFSSQNWKMFAAQRDMEEKLPSVTQWPWK
jgi:hypothetical protein